MSVDKSIVAAIVALGVSSACSATTPAPHGKVWQEFIAGPSASSQKTQGLLAASSAGFRILERDVLGLYDGAPAKELQDFKTATSGNAANLSDTDLCRLHVFGTTNLADESKVQEVRIVPLELANTTFLKEHVSALRKGRWSDGTYEVSLSGGEIASFGQAAFDLAANLEASDKTRAGRLLRLYLRAYLRGEFIDRYGRTYEKPTLIQEPAPGGLPSIDVSGDELAALAGVALEAVFDAVFRMPALYELDSAGNKNYFAEQKTPTFVTLLAWDEKLKSEAESDKAGITRLELELARFVSKHAGTRSQALADLLVSLLKETDLQFVFGAHFAIGDSGAVRSVAESICEVLSRRITDELTYRALKTFEYTVNEKKVITPVPSDDTVPGKLLALLLQEQDLFMKLLPAP